VIGPLAQAFDVGRFVAVRFGGLPAGQTAIWMHFALAWFHILTCILASPFRLTRIQDGDQHHQSQEQNSNTELGHDRCWL